MKGFISAILLGCCCVCCGSGCESKTEEHPVFQEIPAEGYEELTYYLVTPNMDPDGEIKEYLTKEALTDHIVTEEEFKFVKEIRRVISRRNLEDISK